ncbi:IQ domain-containing protein K-like isoform X2 [Apis cerana]|uniref:IQ domain-containing protein K-like isoform X2 n=1 Tax=Apis cerana TaxID=7461 RepID=UPI002B232465|nr:IQ domain-containing protein K-like isoform X2 [Apis cerana]
MNICEKECLNEISESSSVTDSILNNFNNCDCSKHLKKKKEKNIIIQEKNDLLPSNYLDQTIFWLLIPALEETLIEASKQNVLRVQKCRFNGVDYIAEILWNRNPRRSKIFSPPLNVFQIPSFKDYLRLNPRPYYPKSWLWSEDKAALYIQRHIRGWIVRKRSDVQEMRQFWKDIAMKNLFDKKESDILQSQKFLSMVYLKFISVMI